jgi:hypothetical protein
MEVGELLLNNEGFIPVKLPIVVGLNCLFGFPKVEWKYKVIGSHCVSALIYIYTLAFKKSTFGHTKFEPSEFLETDECVGYVDS